MYHDDVNDDEMCVDGDDYFYYYDDDNHNWSRTYNGGIRTKPVLCCL